MRIHKSVIAMFLSVSIFLGVLSPVAGASQLYEAEDAVKEEVQKPRSLYELRNLEGVRLAEDGTTLLSVSATAMHNMTDEEFLLLFSSPASLFKTEEKDDPIKALLDELSINAAQAEGAYELYETENSFLSELDTLLGYQKMYELSDKQFELIKEYILNGIPASKALHMMLATDLFYLSTKEVIYEYHLEQKELELLEDDSLDSLDIIELSMRTGLPASICERVLLANKNDMAHLASELQAAFSNLLSDDGGSNADLKATPQAMQASFNDLTAGFVPDRLLEAPFSLHKSGNIQVNTNTGDYIYTETDLSLPGKNGLDLNISRIYDSSMALTMTPYGMNWGNNNDYAVTVGFDVYEWFASDPYNPRKVTNAAPNYYDPELQSIIAGVRFRYNSNGYVWGGNGELYPDTIAGAIQYYYDLMGWDVDYPNGGHTYVDSFYAMRYPSGGGFVGIVRPAMTPFNTYGLRNDGFDYNYHVNEHGLGHGWRLGLTAIERYYTGPMGEGGGVNPGVAYRLLLPDGRKLEWNHRYNYFENYDLDDLELTRSGSGYAGAAWTLRYRDGKIEYFDENGRVIATLDRFGNKITYQYTVAGQAVTKILITDTMGREITYKNENIDLNTSVRTNENGTTFFYNVKWTLWLGNELVREYYSNKQTGTTAARAVVLNMVTNESGDKTVYTSNNTRTAFNAYMPAPDATSDGVMWRNSLREIRYPDGSMIEIGASNGTNVERLGASGHVVHSTVRTVSYSYEHEAIPYQLRTDYLIGDIHRNKVYNIYTRDDVNGYAYNTAVRKSLYLPDMFDGDIGGAYVIYYVETILYFNYDHLKVKEEIKTRGSFQEELFYRNSDIRNAFDNYHQVSQRLYTERSFTYNSYNLPTSTYTKQYDDHYATGSGATREYGQRYTYNQYGEVTSETLPNGQVITTAYQDYGLPSSRTYKKDAATTIAESYQLTGDRKNIGVATIASNGVVEGRTSYAYNGFGELTGEQNYTSASAFVQTGYLYSGAAQPTSVQVAGVRDSANALVAGSPGFATGTLAAKYTYDNRGRVTGITDPNGSAMSYSYDSAGRVVGAVAPDGGTASYEYTYSWGAAWNKVQYTNPGGHEMENRYDNFGNLREIYDVTNSTLLEKREYDHLNRLMRTTLYSAAGSVTYYYHYDCFDRLIETGIRHNNTSRTPLETYTYYDGQNKMRHVVKGESGSPDIVMWKYYDVMGNTIQTSTIINGVEKSNTFSYDYLGNLIQERSAFTSDKGGAFTNKYTYNTRRNVLTVTNPLNQVASSTYDWLGRQLTATDFKGATSSFSYDNINRLLKESHPFQGAGSSTVYSDSLYTYDQAGNITLSRQMSSLPGQTVTYAQTGYSYDNMNQLIQAAGYQGSSPVSYTHYAYDEMGNVLAQHTGLTTPLANAAAGSYATTGYTYDSRGRLVTVTDALGQAEQYSYDINGLLLQKTDRNGATTTYTYNNRGSLLSIVVRDANNVETARSTNTYYVNGTLKSESANGFTTTYFYNDMGLVMREEDTGGIVRGYTYDAGGNRLTMAMARNGVMQMTMTYAYDTLGRLQQVRENGVLIATYAYDANGNRSSLTYPNGVVTTYGYNAANLITSLQNRRGSATLSSYSYTYFLDGNQRTKTDDTGRTTTYTYDGLGRLTREQESTGLNLSYAYDSFHNRTSLTSTGSDAYVTSYTYDQNNRLLEESKTQGGVSYLTDYYYDANGNTLSTLSSTLSPSSGGAETVRVSSSLDGVTLYGYDGFNRQVKVETEGIVAEYAYRANGLRQSKTVNGVTTTHIWDGGNVIADYVDGTLANRYLRGIGLIGADLAGARSYYLYNAHGDVTSLTNTAGTITQKYDYDAFGNLRDVVGYDLSTDVNPFRYCGEYLDLETNTYYLRARNYNPTTGRFLTEDTHWNPSDMIYGDNPVKWNEGKDPLGLNTYTYVPDVYAIRQSGNLYVYGLNNPLMFVDPNGESIILACILIGAAAGAIIGGFTAAQISKSKLGYVDGKWVLGGAVAGGLVGGLAGWGAGAAATAIGVKLVAGSGGVLGSTMVSSWQQAEQVVRNAYGAVKHTFSISGMSNRIVDGFNSATGVIYEVKYGAASLSQFIQSEIARDVWLRANDASVKAIEWHFYVSQATGAGGPSGPLLEALAEAGIKVVFH